MPLRSRVAATTTAALLAAGLAACSSTPDAGPAAEALARGLASGQLDDVPLAGTTAARAEQQLADATDGMGGRRPSVTVTSVDSGENDTARARLAVSWTLAKDAEPWTYETRARLQLRDDAWRVRWDLAALQPQLVPGADLVLTREQPPRAQVLGRGGQVLVTQRPVERIGIDKARVPATQAQRSARRLATVVDVDRAELAAQVRAAGDKAFVEAIVLRRAEAEQIAAVVDSIPGARRLAAELPLAPTATFARPLLGTVGEATKEVVDASGGRVSGGDVTGLSGLQQRYDARLAGTAGFTVELVGPAPAGDGERPTTELYAIAPTPGTPLRLTLDARTQSLADDVLGNVAPASALVAIQPSSGDLLAVASGAGGAGQSTASVGRFAPGSTFKVVTALALLRRGLTPGSQVQCPPQLVVDGKRFANYGDYPAAALGRIDLRTAVAQSCNTAFIGERQRVSQAGLASAAAALGLGVDLDLGFPAFLGSVPRTAGATEHAASMIGQGRVEASPLAMATVAASIAKGETVRPRLLSDAPSPTPSAGGPAAQPVTSAEASALRGLMRAVVTQGSGRLLADVPGPPVAAKTGTAEYGSAQPPNTHAWMVAIQGDLAVAVFVADGESGSRTAGPLLEQFLRRHGTSAGRP